MDAFGMSGIARSKKTKSSVEFEWHKTVETDEDEECLHLLRSHESNEDGVWTRSMTNLLLGTSRASEVCHHSVVFVSGARLVPASSTVSIVVC